MDSDWRLYNCIKDGNAQDSKSLWSEVLGDRPEQTLAGATIGAAHDLVDAPDNLAERYKRAEKHDMAAHFVADSVSIVPKFRAATAGLARATLLADPHRGFEGNIEQFSKNFLEGAALNKVGKMMLPGSSLTGFARNNLGRGLLAESFTHVSTGASFGLVKSGFDSRSWYDEHGQFSGVRGAESMLKGSLLGGTINLPAGLLGMRVARGSMGLFAEGQISQRTASTIAGVTSGYTGGLVFGGIDAQMRGMNFKQTLDHMNTAGIAGGLTGGFISSFDRGRLLTLYNEPSPTQLRNHEIAMAETLPTRRGLLQETSFAASESSSANPNPRIRFQAEQLSDGDIAALTYRESGDFSGRSNRITPKGLETLDVSYLKNGSPETFDTFETFRSHLEVRPVKVRVYELEGHQTRLLVKESYAQKQEAVRDMYGRAEKKVPFDLLSAEQRADISNRWNTAPDRLALLSEYMNPADARRSLPVIQDRINLQDPQLQQVVLPEEFLAFLEQLPNRGLVKRIIVMDEPSSVEPWHKSMFKNPNHSTAAQAGRDGDLTFFFKPDKSRPSRTTLGGYVRHEWSHLSDFRERVDSELFRLAARVDRDIPDGPGRVLKDSIFEGQEDAALLRDKYYRSDYSARNDQENWAVHTGEEFLSPDTNVFLGLADGAPVRTSIIARNLMFELNNSNVKTSNRQAIMNRILYVEDVVLPRAVKVLEGRMTNGSPQEQALSAELMGYLGHPAHNSKALRDLALRPSSSVVPDGVIPAGADKALVQGGTSVDGRRTVSDIAFDALVRMRSRRGSPFDVLVEEGRPGSPTRDLSLARLGVLEDPMAPKYFKYLSLAGNPDNLPELIPLMREMPNTTGREMVFNEILALGKGSPEFTSSVVKNALAYSPDLRARALELVPRDGDQHMMRIVARLSRHKYDPVVAKRAGEVLGELQTHAKLIEASNLSGSGRGADQVKVLDLLEGVTSRDAIKPLLTVAATGSEANSARALGQLGKFNSQVVKFYAHDLGRSGLAIDAKLLSRIGRGS